MEIVNVTLEPSALESGKDFFDNKVFVIKLPPTLPSNFKVTFCNTLLPPGIVSILGHKLTKPNRSYTIKNGKLKIVPLKKVKRLAQ